MGMIRILLAIAVLTPHALVAMQAEAFLELRYIDPMIAVQTFFIISGFYMSLILHEKYNAPNSYRLFITNRILRLFPTYYLVIIVSFILAFVFNRAGYPQELINGFSKLEPGTWLYLVFVNLAIVGQDTTLFLGLTPDGTLRFVKDFYDSNPPVYTFLLCVPAWSLSLELMFYFIAPFLVRKNIRVILLIMGIAFILRVFIYLKVAYSDPWTYRFFPTELFFFLAGNISYRIYVYIRYKEYALKAGLPFLAGTLLYMFVYNYIPVIYPLKLYLFYGYMTVAIPFIFNYTKKMTADRLVGELSYPIYLSHVLIIAFGIPVINRYVGLDRYNNLLAIAFTAFFSWLLYILLIKPVDRLRETRVTRSV